MLLVCSAWKEEIQELDPSLTKANIIIKPLGIGFLDASIELSRLLSTNSQINKIIFLGTAGTCKKNLAIGEILSIKSTSLLNLGTRIDLSYSPIKNNLIESKKVFSGFKAAHCLTSIEITKKENLVLDDEEFILENMELFGIARTAEKFSIEWSALLSVTNFVGSNAHQEWLLNHKECSKNLCKKFLEAINKEL
jgi:nucleoside phosphorylase